jgi:transcriptional regulator with XRE-family HTH domain
MQQEDIFMPTPHRPPPSARRALKKLGEDIRDARLRRKLPMEIVAERAATSRPTVARIEKGDSSVSIGIFAAVLQALNLLERLADVADAAHDEIGQSIAKEELPRRASTIRRRKGLS